MARLSLKLLGSMQVTLDESPIESFESDKTRALLAYLAVESARPHPREALAEMLWPNQPEGRARHSLSQVLFILRTILGDRPATGKLSPNMPADRHIPFLLITPHSIQINPQANFSSDVAHFKELLTGCGVQDHTTRATCKDCMQRFQQAVSLYTSDFLADLYLRDCLAFEEWAIVIRERLRNEVQHALDCLTKYHEQRGELELAMQYAYRQVTNDPFRETAHRFLMRSLAQNGQRSAALAQYNALKNLLETELDAEPERETTALYERLRIESDSATATGELPQALTPFIGRQDELLALGEMLRDPSVRLITLLGPGGSGKTRLALEAAHPLRYHYTHGVYLIPLSALDSPASLLPAIAEALGLRLREGEDPQNQLCAYLKTRRLLLLLDSFERLLEGAPQLADLLRLAPGLKMLVTSRARLDLKGEQLYLLGGMSYPHDMHDDDPLRYSSVQLFLSAARRVRSGFQLTQEHAEAVVRICALVDGMPLGILLASAWVDQFSPAEIARQVERSLDFLSIEWRDIPHRQRSLRATFDYSWDLLVGSEQQALAGMSVFRGSFNREAAQQVTGAGHNELRGLSAKSLLQVLPDGRYLLHDLVHQFASGRLAGQPDLEQSIRECHSTFYLQVARDWQADLVSARQWDVLKEIDLEIEDLRAACRWAAAQGHFQPLEAALEAVCLYFSLRMRLEEGASLCRSLVELPGQDAFMSEDRRLQAHLLTWQAHFERLLGQPAQARRQLDQARSLLDELGHLQVDTRPALALWWQELGTLENNLPARQDANQLSANLYRQLGQTWRLAGVINNLSGVYARLGEHANARAMLLEVVTLSRAIGEARSLARILMTLAYNLIQTGEFSEALSAMREAADCFYSIGDQYNAALGSLHLGTMYIWHGRNQEARQLLERSLPVLQETGDRFGYTIGCLGMTILMLQMGDYAAGLHYIQIVLDSAQEHGYRREIALGHALMAILACQEGDTERGLRLACKSVELYREMGYRGEMGGALGFLALVYYQLCDTHKAQSSLRETLQIIQESHALFPLLWTLPASVLLLMEMGRIEKALETYTALTCIPTWQGSRWIEDLLGEQMRSLQDSLPKEALEVSQQRGETIDPYDLAAELLELFTSTDIEP